MEMQVRLMVAAHFGIGGRRGQATTKEILAQYFIWANMDDTIEKFVTSCLHCLSSAPGNKVPRPLGEAIHATKPNEVLHFDYLYMGTGGKEKLYPLIRKDDMGSFVRLYAVSEADAAATAECLVD
jgi:Integrase zinc binding domain